MLRYIIKLFLPILFCAAFPYHLVANDQSLKHKIWPTTCWLGLDISKACVGWYHKRAHQYEINGGLNFSRLLLNLDYAKGKIQRDHRQHKGSFASASGQYFRVGLDYNFLTPTVHHNQFFIGFRYARSFFDFEIKSNKLQCMHPPTDSCTNTCTAPVFLQNRQGTGIAHWWEVVAGGKVYLMRIVSIGCTIRYKFNKKIESDLSTLPFDIPGFGLGEFDHAFGYSLYLLIRIPLQKKNNAYHASFSQKSVNYTN